MARVFSFFATKAHSSSASTFATSTSWISVSSSASHFPAYPEAVSFHLGTRTDFAILVKEYGTETQEERRYSPPRIIAATKTAVHGSPVEERICTSHVERLNLDVRMKCRRFTRLTNAFSKKLASHRAAVALTVAHYNLVKMHSSIRMTPAMKAGVTSRIWSVGELLAAAWG